MDDSAGSGHTLELRLRRLGQLFSSLDPAPFSEKDLDPAAEQFILDWAEQPERRRGEFRLRIWLGSAGEAGESSVALAPAIHNFFGVLARSERSRLRQLVRDGQISLAIGLIFITLCLTAAGWLEDIGSSSRFLSALSESLIVAGWVGMWRPIEIALYDWWPIRRRMRVLERLAHAKVDVRSDEPQEQEDSAA